MSVADKGVAWWTLITLVVTGVLGGLAWTVTTILDTKAAIAQEAAKAGAEAGKVAAEGVVEPLSKTLEQIRDQGVAREVRDEKSYCMEFYHQEVQPRARNRLCNNEADVYKVWLVCKLKEKPDCGPDPRREE